MPPFRHWAELPPDLLCRVGDVLDLKYYSSARGACTAWRCALARPTPSLLLVLGDATSAASLLTRRSFELKAIPAGARCVGSSNGWIALSFRVDDGHSIFSLFNPVTATKIVLPPLFYGRSPLSKLVFSPNPARDDFAAAAICDVDMLAYVTAGARRWAILGPVRLAVGDRLADVVYHEKGKVHTPGAASASVPAISVRQAKQHPYMLFSRSVGPDLNAPATVSPLLCLPSATNFAWPYSKVSLYTSAKNLVFVKGNLYQIWRNMGGTVTLCPSRDGYLRLAEDEVFVLRYYPRRQPCWVVVTDLGGYSVFLGTNNAVSMYAEDVPGLKGNCVYWIGGRGRDQGMVFDMATGSSAACLPAAAAGVPKRTICWYFLKDVMNK
ncbi:unnamed protein product [Alopecurus aequalis]